MHEERFEVEAETARLIDEASGSVVAVGTTTLRVLESVARENQGRIVPGRGRTRIFIYPPFRFQIVDRLVTNFHLPCSTLLMLASAFTAPDEVADASFCWRRIRKQLPALSVFQLRRRDAYSFDRTRVAFSPAGHQPKGIGRRFK